MISSSKIVYTLTSREHMLNERYHVTRIVGKVVGIDFARRFDLQGWKYGTGIRLGLKTIYLCIALA